MRPAVAKVRIARAYIESIPDSAFDLDTFYEPGEGPSCGTVACAAGHLALARMFGLKISRGPDPIVWSMPSFADLGGFKALRKAFDLDQIKEVLDLFGIVGDSRYDGKFLDQEGLSDICEIPRGAGHKALFLYRCDRWLEENAE